MFKSLLPYFIVMMLTFSVVIGVGVFKPQVIDKFIVTVDTIGITTRGAQEQYRLRAINALTITYEEKQALVNHSVFIGATPEMVELALGAPQKKGDEVQDSSIGTIVTYIYVLPQDTRPTALEFHNGKLASAQKVSALDAPQ